MRNSRPKSSSLQLEPFEPSPFNLTTVPTKPSSRVEWARAAAKAYQQKEAEISRAASFNLATNKAQIEDDDNDSTTTPLESFEEDSLHAKPAAQQTCERQTTATVDLESINNESDDESCKLIPEHDELEEPQIGRDMGNLVPESDVIEDYIFDVDQIVSVRQNQNRSEFLVQWADSDETTWEPWNNLLDSDLQEEAATKLSEYRARKEDASIARESSTDAAAAAATVLPQQTQTNQWTSSRRNIFNVVTPSNKKNSKESSWRNKKVIRPMRPDGRRTTICYLSETDDEEEKTEEDQIEEEKDNNDNDETIDQLLAPDDDTDGIDTAEDPYAEQWKEVEGGGYLAHEAKDSNDEDEFPVESLLKVWKTDDENFEFLVKWLGSYRNTWEPQENLNGSLDADAQTLVEEYKKSNGQGSKRKASACAPKPGKKIWKRTTSATNAHQLACTLQDRETVDAGRRCRIFQGANASNKIATVAKIGKRKDLVIVQIGDKEVSVKRTSLEFDLTKEYVASLESESSKARSVVSKRTGAAAASSRTKSTLWTVPGAFLGGETISGRRLKKIVLHEDEKSEITLFNQMFQNRILQIHVELDGRSTQKPLDSNLVQNGCRYVLISVKVTEEEQAFKFSTTKTMNCVYFQAEGPNVPQVDPWEELLRIADFSRLPTRKIVSRLELLQSPAAFDVHGLKHQDFVSIEEEGNVGCGFIEERFLEQMLLEMGMTPKSHAKLVLAIQIRAFSSEFGVIKGVLVRSSSFHCQLRGNAPIQFPPSMVKVPPSSHHNPHSEAAIVICKNGIHPSSGSANEYIGRALDPNRKPPTKKSFASKIDKPLKDMVFRLFKTMQVPDSDFKEYKNDCLHPERRNHAWLVGVIDPTGSLPPDTVFVPGMKTVQRKSLFVTRSPCVKYEDGRLLTHATRKPKQMTDSDWQWLNSLAFGCIIFSKPRKGKMSMPERIAAGDLDGDLYLVCWDRRILSKMEAAPLVDIDCTDDGQLEILPPNEAWFEDAQQMMLDAGSLNDMNGLIGKLYTEAGKIADDHPTKNGVPFCLRHPDAMAMFAAFNQALDFKKHGRKIELPEHLHTKVPLKFRHLLSLPLAEE